MRVLVACEFSGVVRDAFIERGHSAISCDLLPCESDKGMHIQGNLLGNGGLYATINRSLGDGWEPDLIIAHPPCTYLCNSGVRWLYYGGKGNIRNAERWSKMEEAAAFFKCMLASPAPYVAVENPIMHRHASDIIGRGPDQLIHPWQHGHGETKSTGLWLKNLPLLRPSQIVKGREARVHRASPGPDRWKERSRTLPGIAAAMADQWGNSAMANASVD